MKQLAEVTNKMNNAMIEADTSNRLERKSRQMYHDSRFENEELTKQNERLKNAIEARAADDLNRIILDLEQKIENKDYRMRMAEKQTMELREALGGKMGIIEAMIPEIEYLRMLTERTHQQSLKENERLTAEVNRLQGVDERNEKLALRVAELETILNQQGSFDTVARRSRGGLGL